MALEDLLKKKEEKPLIGGTNIFFKALDLLNTPQQAIFGAVKYGGLEGAEKGMREDVSFYDLLGDMEEGPGRTALGLAGDIVLDPVNLIPGAAVAKLTKVPKVVKAVSGVDKALNAIRATDKGGRAFEFANKALRSSVARRAGLGPEGNLVQDLAEEAESVRRSQRIVRENLAGELKAKGFSIEAQESLLGRGRSPFVNSLSEDRLLEIRALPSPRELAARTGIDEDLANRLIVRRIERKTGTQGELVSPESLLFKKGPPAAGKLENDLEDIAGVIDPEKVAPIEGATGNLFEDLAGVSKEARETIADRARELRKYIDSDEEWLGIQGIDPEKARLLLKDEAWDRWAEVGRRTRDMSQAQNVAAGLPALKLADEQTDYILHIATPELRKAAIEAGVSKGLGRQWSAAHASMLGRVLKGVDVDRLNALGREGLIPGMEGRIIKKAVHDDPITLEVFRQMRDVKSREAAKLYQRAFLLSESQKLKGVEGFAEEITSVERKAELAKKGWKTVDPMPGAPQQVKDAAPLQAWADNVMWHPDVADVLQRYQEFATAQFRNDTGPMSKFWEVWEGITGAWKATGLSWRPDYHMRNEVSNIWMAFMSLDNVAEVPALVKQADAVAQTMVRFVPRTSAAGTVLGGFLGTAAGASQGETTAERIRNAAIGMAGGAAVGRVTTVSRAMPTFKYLGKDIPAGEFFTLAENMGILNSGQYAGELADLIAESGKAVKRLADLPVLKQGRRFGEILEQHARASVFAHRLAKGDTAVEAAAFTKKAMVDYGNMTPLERSLSRRAFPFYAWTKNNGVLTVSTLVNPGKWGRIQGAGDIINTVQRDVEPPRWEDRVIPRFIQDKAGIRIREDENGNPEYFLLGGWLPTSDIVELAKPFTERAAMDKWDLVLQSLAPQIKAPIEYLSNRDLYFRQEIERFPGEQQKVFGMQIQKRYWQVLKSIIALNQAEDLMNSIVPGSSDRTPKNIFDQITQRMSGMKVYQLDEGRSLANYFYRKERAMGETKALIRRAAKNKDTADIPTLIDRYKRIARNEEDLD